jgi:hypothetical protein
VSTSASLSSDWIKIAGLCGDELIGALDIAEQREI